MQSLPRRSPLPSVGAVGSGRLDCAFSPGHNAQRKLPTHADPPDPGIAMAQRILKIAVVYLFLGTLLGITMGIMQSFALVPVHAHVLASVRTVV